MVTFFCICILEEQQISKAFRTLHGDHSSEAHDDLEGYLVS